MPNRKVVGRLKGASRDLIEIEWEIADFLSLPAEVDVYLGSPTFFFCNASWYLRLYPNGEKWNSSEGHIGVYVMREDSGPPVTVTYSLFFKKTDGRYAACNTERKTFDGKNQGWGRSKSIERPKPIDEKSDFLPSGVFTVVCSLECDDTKEMRGIGRDVASQTTECIGKDVALQTSICSGKDVALQATLYDASKSKALCDLEKILLNKEGCDVTLQVKEQKFEAHRTILKARSSVFASMLSLDMKEKNTGLVDIEDCEPEHFSDFLHFLYCGSVDNITSQNMCSLYRAGDKYDVQDLKSECLTFIKSHLEIDSFCDVITLALQHRETDLIKQATAFFAKNMLNILMTVKWQIFLRENPDESNELMIAGLSAQKSSNN